MNEATPQVQNITQVTTVSPTGQPVVTYSIRFVIGSDGPFTITIPQAEFSAANVIAKMQAFAAELKQLPRQA